MYQNQTCIKKFPQNLWKPNKFDEWQFPQNLWEINEFYRLDFKMTRGQSRLKC